MDIVDTNCFCNMDGFNDRPPVSFDDQQRQIIWLGLRRLADAGEIAIVHQQIEEIKRHYKGDLDWMAWMPVQDTRLGVDEDLDQLYQELTRQFHMVNPRMRHTLFPADGHIVARAMQLGYGVVSDELDRRTRKNRRSYDSIPDVCNALNPRVQVRDFETFLRDNSLYS